MTPLCGAKLIRYDWYLLKGLKDLQNVVSDSLEDGEILPQKGFDNSSMNPTQLLSQELSIS